MLHSEFEANLELAKAVKQAGVARYMFNLTGDDARRALANMKGKRPQGIISKISSIIKEIRK